MYIIYCRLTWSLFFYFCKYGYYNNISNCFSCASHLEGLNGTHSSTVCYSFKMTSWCQIFVSSQVHSSQLFIVIKVQLSQLNLSWCNVSQGAALPLWVILRITWLNYLVYAALHLQIVILILYSFCNHVI